MGPHWINKALKVFIAVLCIFTLTYQYALAQVYCPDADFHYSSSDIDKALEKFLECRQDYWEKKDYDGYFKTSWMVLDCYSKRKETTTLLMELDHLKELSHLVPDSLRDSDQHVRKQFEFLLARMTGDLGTALDSQLRILDSLEALSPVMTIDKASRIFKSRMYTAEVYLERGSYRQALYYANKAIDNSEFIREGATVDGFILTPYYVLVRAYILTGDSRGALNELNRILRIIPNVRERQSERRISAYIDICDLHLRENSIDSAEYYYALVRKEPAAGPFRIPILMLEAEIKMARLEIDAVLEIYNSLIDSLEAIESYNSDMLAEIHTDLGNVLLPYNDDPIEALQHFHKAIYLMSSAEFNSDRMSNPKLNALYEKTTLVAALNGKGAALDQLALNASPEDKEKLVSGAWSAIRLGLDFVRNMRSAHRTAEDRARLIEDSYLLYETALTHCESKTHLNSQERWVDTAFALMESSKALNLLDDLTHKEAREIAGIPANLIELELAMRADINQLKKRERELRAQPAENGQLLRSNFSLLRKAETSLDSLIDQFNLNNPDYRASQESLNTPSLVEAQRSLKAGETVLEYFVGRKRIYLVRYDSKSASLLICEDPGTVRYGISQIALSMTEVLNDANATVGNDELLGHLNDLYVWLIEPAGELNEHLIIIPDGPLNGLPFAALLTTEPGQTHDLRDQQYLLRTHSILYSYSSTIQIRLRSDAISGQAESYAFSPEIDSASGFLPLAFSAAEASEVGELLGAHVISGEDCSASSVKDLLGQKKQFEVIHFATHGVADLNHGVDSYLQFSGITDTSRLFAYDLYNLDFNAALVYLSACQTATGSQQSGEGIVSMARAFFRSGARNLVTTMNSVGDRQAGEVTDAFYSELMQGNRVDVALARAQRDYLNSIRNEERYLAHPAYWSGFVAYGDAMPVLDESIKWYLWAGAVLLLILAFALLSKRIMDKG